MAQRAQSQAGDSPKTRIERLENAHTVVEVTAK
jgi:hypothetical protein